MNNEQNIMDIDEYVMPTRVRALLKRLRKLKKLKYKLVSVKFEQVDRATPGNMNNSNCHRFTIYDKQKDDLIYMRTVGNETDEELETFITNYRFA